MNIIEAINDGIKRVRGKKGYIALLFHSLGTSPVFVIDHIGYFIEISDADARAAKIDPPIRSRSMKAEILADNRWFTAVARLGPAPAPMPLGAAVDRCQPYQAIRRGEWDGDRKIPFATIKDATISFLDAVANDWEVIDDTTPEDTDGNRNVDNFVAGWNEDMRT